MSQIPVKSCIFVSTPTEVRVFNAVDEDGNPVEYCGQARIVAFKKAFGRDPETQEELLESTSPVCPVEIEVS